MTKEKAQPEKNVDLSTGPKGKTDKKGQAIEVGGRKGPEPTRYGDWEKNGIISDF